MSCSYFNASHKSLKQFVKLWPLENLDIVYIYFEKLYSDTSCDLTQLTK